MAQSYFSRLLATDQRAKLAPLRPVTNLWKTAQLGAAREQAPRDVESGNPRRTAGIQHGGQGNGARSAMTPLPGLPSPIVVAKDFSRSAETDSAVPDSMEPERRMTSSLGNGSVAVSATTATAKVFNATSGARASSSTDAARGPRNAATHPANYKLPEQPHPEVAAHHQPVLFAQARNIPQLDPEKPRRVSQDGKRGRASEGRGEAVSAEAGVGVTGRAPASPRAAAPLRSAQTSAAEFPASIEPAAQTPGTRLRLEPVEITPLARSEPRVAARPTSPADSSRAGQRSSIHIGRIEVQVIPPQPASFRIAPQPAPPRTRLARGYSLWSGR